MSEAIFWGLVQGLTEFLPISSSGHLVLVPAVLGMDEPGLAVTAVLHLGTLAAVLVYYRRDLVKVLKFRTDVVGRQILWLLIIGTIPAGVVGLLAEDKLDELFESPTRVAIALIVTGVVLLASRFLLERACRVEDGKPVDAITIGLAQATALVPGISRSGVTIVAGLGRGLTAAEAARFSFLLGIPAIAGGGFKQALDLSNEGGLTPEVWLGALVAAIVGYVSISALLRVIQRFGLLPFSLYCFVAGTVALLAV